MELRPARRPTETPNNTVSTTARFPSAPFVAHVLAQYDPAEPNMRDAAMAYAAIDALAYELPKVVVASL